MLTVSDLKEACEAIINGTYAESMTRDSSGTLYLRGHRKDCIKTGMKQSYSLKDIAEEEVINKIKTIEYDSYGTYVLLVSPDTKERIGDSIKLPDNVLLRTSPFVEENKAYLLRVGTDMGRGNGKMTGTLKLIRAMSKGIEALEERNDKK